MSDTVSSHLLEIKNLTIEFGQGDETVTALNDVSISIPAGSTVGIVGESGSGKSVTALAVMGLLQTPPAKIKNGSINFAVSPTQSINLLSLNNKERNHFRGKKISMIFQEPMTSLNPVMRCGEQIAEILYDIKFGIRKNRKAAYSRVINLFNEVELPYPEIIFKSYPHQLSGGQKQRVMIAMAIAHEPDLLIADEPTTALDVTIQKKIVDLLKKLQNHYGMSMMFITHDLSLISNIADHIIIMHNGKVVEAGTARNIFTQPQEQYTKGLLACRPPMDRRPVTLPTVKDFIDSGNSTDKLKKLFNNDISNEERLRRQSSLYGTEPILKVKNLHTVFPIKGKMLSRKKEFFKAVDNISFELYKGETLGLVGESGCGKTTLGRSILRLIESGEGEIIYKGIDIKQLSSSEMRKVRRNIQIVFQDPYSSLNPRLTIGNAITEPMSIHKFARTATERKARAIDLLERVGLSALHYNRYPHEFSGGQRQRICIARALALQPEIIICDESVSALDVSVQAQVLNLLNELKNDYGITYIFISHDLSVVRYMSDRIAVMHKGKICEIGEADNLFNYSESEHTKKLIEAIPVLSYHN